MLKSISLLRNQSGATIVEMLIAGLLTVIVAGAGMEFYGSQHKVWQVQRQVGDIQQNARVALDDITHTLRMGGYHLTSHPACMISADSLVIYYFRESVGDVDTISYFISRRDPSHPTLMRMHKRQTPEAFAEDIESLTVTAVSIRLLTVTLTARGDKTDSELIAGDGYRRRTYTTQVRLRNV
jgi:Flp pilus assembly pilin Flp